MAVEFERKLNNAAQQEGKHIDDPDWADGISGAWLTNHMKPLDQIDFGDNQLKLFDDMIDECEGLCGL
jgi:hypothetical protein